MQRETSYCVLLELYGLDKELSQTLIALSFSRPSPTRALFEPPRQGTSRTSDNSECADLRASKLDIAAIDMHYKGAYLPNKTQHIDLGQGIVHLFRSEEEVDTDTLSIASTNDQLLEKSDNVLAILAIPSYMSSADLLGFFGDSLHKIAHLRIIRTNDLSRYIVLLKFRTARNAQTFKQRFNGAVFNPFEPETVHCVYVSCLLFCGRLRAAAEFPLLTNHAQEARRTSHKMTQKALPPTMSLIEVPTCVVCLERMDADTTGLLTIACEHTFHCSCITKWVDAQATCPICRFSVTRVSAELEMRCSVSECASGLNLWMCLLCGSSNCGRYESQHAIRHYERTRHAFAMDLASGRIWDYSSDSYVHQLLQDKLDATQHAHKHSEDGKSAQCTNATEFEELLAAQLDSQRIFFEEQLSAAVKKAARAGITEQKLRDESQELLMQLYKTREEFTSLQDHQKSMDTSHTQLERKCKVLSDLSRKSRELHLEELSINKSLMERLSYEQTRLAKAQSEVVALSNEAEQLREQVHDFMMHFAGAEQLATLKENELDGASIHVRPSAKHTMTSNKHRRRTSDC